MKKIIYRLVNSNNETVQTFDNPKDFDSKDYTLLWREDKYGAASNTPSRPGWFPGESYLPSTATGIETYKLIPYEWCRSKKDYLKWADTENYYIKCFVKKADLEKFVRVEKAYKPLVKALIREGLFDKYILVYDKNKNVIIYVSKEIDEDIKKIKEPHTPFVIKGKRFPYYFKIFGKMLPSSTTNYYTFISRWIGVMPEFVEEYKGEELPEKEKEEYIKANYATTRVDSFDNDNLFKPYPSIFDYTKGR